eukprot:GGOE01024157.1.p4 GENE.GGOE01024157.1~~GGOE01024157.1.p4  ORF type:complete len:101 (+),score=3.59 GGOE01024157.1:945-1247(+)
MGGGGCVIRAVLHMSGLLSMGTRVSRTGSSLYLSEGRRWLATGGDRPGMLEAPGKLSEGVREKTRVKEDDRHPIVKMAPDTTPTVATRIMPIIALPGEKK